ncbi:hypothetical protein HDU76_011318, partial [Blyttiomyces sp. JEL0837]
MAPFESRKSKYYTYTSAQYSTTTTTFKTIILTVLAIFLVNNCLLTSVHASPLPRKILLKLSTSYSTQVTNPPSASTTTPPPTLDTIGEVIIAFRDNTNNNTNTSSQRFMKSSNRIG